MGDSGAAMEETAKASANGEDEGSNGGYNGDNGRGNNRTATEVAMKTSMKMATGVGQAWENGCIGRLGLGVRLLTIEGHGCSPV